MGKRSFSKRLVADIRLLLWVVTLGGLIVFVMTKIGLG